MSKWQYCCFTINNWTQDDIDTLINSEYLRYYVYGEEVGEKKKTPHLQGYLQTTKQVTQKYLKSILPRAKLIKSKAKDQKYASLYCKKGEQTKSEWKELKETGPNYGKNAKVTEFGEMGKGQGTRTDLLKIKRKVLEEKLPINVVVENYVENYQQLRFAEGLIKYIEPSEEYKEKEVYWFWGPTGLGKTKTAFEMAKERNMKPWLSGDNSRWYQGYWGQEFVIIDDLRAKDWSYSTLLKLTDGYERRLEIKGSDTIWKPKVIVITSPMSPEDTYRGQIDYNDHINQLLRRLSWGERIREFKAEEPVLDTSLDLALKKIDEELSNSREEARVAEKRPRDEDWDFNDNVKKKK